MPAVNRKTRQLMEQASRGNAAAQRELAHCFFYGRGVKRSVVEALGWLLLAARAQDSGALNLVCELCRRNILPAVTAARLR
jgi:TPR repeat protein